MALSHHHLAALLTPAGRVTPLVFFSFFVPLMALDLVLYKLVSAVPVAERGVSGAAILMLAVVWMQFCLLSRRRQDIGESGLPFIGFALLALLCWCKTVDPTFLDPNLPASHRFANMVPYMHQAGRALAFVLFFMFLSTPGSDGPNAFGQEFGESSDRVSRWRTESVMGVLEAAPVPPPAPVIPARPKPINSEEAAARRRRTAAMPLPGETSGGARRSSAFGRR